MTADRAEKFDDDDRVKTCCMGAAGAGGNIRVGIVMVWNIMDGYELEGGLNCGIKHISKVRRR